MTISIRREDFSSHFASRSLNVNTMSAGLRESFAAHGIDEARLQRAANFDGEIRGEDFDRLFQELQSGDRVQTAAGRATTLDRASSLFTMLDREASPIVVRGTQQQQQQGGTGLRGPMGTGRAPLPQQQPAQGTGQTAQAQPAVVAPPPPGPPPDMARLTALRQRADNATVPTSEVSAARQTEIRATLRRAEDASQRGDYAAAAAAYRELGLPLSLSPGAQADPRAWETARMIGAVGQDGRYSFGARGNQQLNDLNSFASNAQMMDAMVRANIGQVSNPPTQAQAQAFMRHVGQSRDPQAVMQASSMMTNGMINHYSSAGAANPAYGPRMYTFNAGGQHYQFDNMADAQRAARQHGVRNILYIDTPGDWANAMRHPERAGRRVGDCENKEYMQHQMTAAAGFTQLGSVDIQGGGTGHMLGVMRDPNSGRTFLTSNESFYEVRGTGTNGAVTNADIQRTAQQAATDIYGSTRGLTFSYAREPAGSTVDPGVAAMRRAQGRVNEGVLP